MCLKLLCSAGLPEGTLCYALKRCIQNTLHLNRFFLFEWRLALSQHAVGYACATGVPRSAEVACAFTQPHRRRPAHKQYFDVSSMYLDGLSAAGGDADVARVHLHPEHPKLLSRADPSR
jgi:hypothetical protein